MSPESADMPVPQSGKQFSAKKQVRILLYPHLRLLNLIFIALFRAASDLLLSSPQHNMHQRIRLNFFESSRAISPVFFPNLIPRSTSCEHFLCSGSDFLCSAHKKHEIPALLHVLRKNFSENQRFLYSKTTFFEILWFFTQNLQKTCCFLSETIYNG